MTHDVFICHSSQDRTIANAMCAKLEGHGIRCWIAPRDVIPGVEYAQSIIEAIGRSTLTVLVFSAHANSSPHVRRELERTASHGIPILPFRVEDVVPAPSVEYFISDAHWLDAMTPPMEQHLEHLVGTVRLLLERQAALTGAGEISVPAVVQPATAKPESGGRALPVGKGVLYAVVAAVVLVGVVIALVLALNGPGSSDGTAPTVAASERTGQQGTADDAEDPSAPVIIEFDDGLGEGWRWENEDPQAWTVEDGALRVGVQQSPPLRNVLLRDLPEGDIVIQTRIDFDPSPPGHAAGLVLTGDDLGDRVELWWTTEGLVLTSFEDDVMLEGVEIAPDQFAPGEWVGAELSFEIASGQYTARFQSPVTPNWLIHTAPLPDLVTHVGLLAYATEEAGGETAVFTRFVLQ